MFAAVFGDPPPVPGRRGGSAADRQRRWERLAADRSGFRAAASGRCGPCARLFRRWGECRFCKCGGPGTCGWGKPPAVAPPSVMLSEGEGAATVPDARVGSVNLARACGRVRWWVADRPLGRDLPRDGGAPKDGPVTKAQAFQSPAGAVDGLVPDPRSAINRVRRIPQARTVSLSTCPGRRGVSVGKGGPSPQRPALPAMPALPADSGVPAVPARRAVPAVPAATSAPSGEGPLAANDPPVPPAALPSDQGREQVLAPTPKPAGQTRIWLWPPPRGKSQPRRNGSGLADCIGMMPGGETECNARESMLPLRRGPMHPWPRAPGKISRLAGLSQAALPRAALQTTEPEEALPQLEPDLPPLSWSSAGPPALTGSTVSGPLPAGAVPQLAAAMVATLHQKPDGTTEIALSPDELGSVRLRLEADARDPERMIVHLVFDRPETMDLFRRHADQLSEAIRAAGYAEARLDFGQSGRGADPQGGQAADTAKPPPELD